MQWNIRQILDPLPQVADSWINRHCSIEQVYHLRFWT